MLHKNAFFEENVDYQEISQISRQKCLKKFLFEFSFDFQSQAECTRIFLSRCLDHSNRLLPTFKNIIQQVIKDVITIKKRYLCSLGGREFSRDSGYAFIFCLTSSCNSFNISLSGRLPFRKTLTAVLNQRSTRNQMPPHASKTRPTFTNQTCVKL